MTKPLDLSPQFSPKLETIIDAFTQLVPEVDAVAIESFLRVIYASRLIFLAIEANFARHDLSNGKFGVLMMLLRHKEEGVQPSEVAKKLGVTRGTVTGLLDGLERSGLLQREPHPGDRRKQLLRLTKKGERLLTGLLPDYGRRITEIMAGLDEAERLQLSHLTDKLMVGIPAMSEA